MQKLKTYYITHHINNEFKMHYHYGIPFPVAKLVGVDEYDAITKLSIKDVNEMFNENMDDYQIIPFMKNSNLFIDPSNNITNKEKFYDYLEKYGENIVAEEVVKLAQTNPKKIRNELVKTLEGYYNYGFILIDENDRLFKIMILNEKKY